MACPLCGDRCTCSSTVGSASAGASVSVCDDVTSTSLPNLSDTGNTGSRVTIAPSRAATAEQHFYQPNQDADDAWRKEASSRLQAHRARRRKRLDPDATLSLGFAPLISTDEAGEALGDGNAFLQNSYMDTNVTPIEVPSRRRRMAAKAVPDDNLILFPRASSVHELLPDELAEPITTTPRILDVPDEVAEPAAQPVFASIQLDAPDEDSLQAPAFKLELPLQVAPIAPRFTAAMIDAVLVLTATALFCVVELTMGKFVPEGKLLWAAAMFLPALFGALYEYLFLAFIGETPGMQMAQLQLTSFEGCVPTRKMRVLRAVAALLSCASMGLGFAWALVDDDSLAWHDRITRTYLRQC